MSQHSQSTKNTANILKTLTFTKWSEQEELIVYTFNLLNAQIQSSNYCLQPKYFFKIAVLRLSKQFFVLISFLSCLYLISLFFIFVLKPDITIKNVKTSSTFTLPSLHNTLIPEKNNKVTNTTLYEIQSLEQT